MLDPDKLPEYIDKEALLDLVQNTSTTMFPELIKSFLEEIASINDKLSRDQTLTGDPLADLAHGLKSNAGTFGAKPLFDVARDLELTARAGEDLGDLVAKCIHEAETTARIFHELLSKITDETTN